MRFWFVAGVASLVGIVGVAAWVMEPSGCPDVHLEFAAAPDLEQAPGVNVTDAQLASVSEDVAQTFRQALDEGSAELAIPEADFQATISPALKRLDPDHSHIWHHADGTARLSVIMC